MNEQQGIKPYVIGLDLGGTNSVFGLVDARGDIKATTAIKTGSYEKDGRTVYTTEVIANNVEFLSSGQQGQGQMQGQGFGQSAGFGQQGGFSQPAPAPTEQPGEIDVPGGFTSLQDDDIPF